ncbi:tyrosine-protein phosphatase [Glutamicibacter sp. NPDC087344]|uniref:tyrosine-protein phosphatase n=1 Tax=Glutamicibacter sp. NPDC087344 TaxID=3363994 RepID=UPI0037FD8310
MSHAAEYRKQSTDVHWDGAINARRICGVFYRMGRHEWLTSAGWEQLRADGIDLVLDLRNESEIRRREHDPVVDALSLRGIDLINLPLESPGNDRFEAVAVPYMNHTGMYRLVCEEFGSHLAQVFEALAQTPTAAVIHCSAGRDRSGLVATLLLDLAGRRDEVLAHDEAAVRGINEWHRVSPRKHPYESHQGDIELHQIIRSRAEELDKFLHWLGTAEDYLRSQGVSGSTLATLHRLTRADHP